MHRDAGLNDTTGLIAGRNDTGGNDYDTYLLKLFKSDDKVKFNVIGAGQLGTKDDRVATGVQATNTLAAESSATSDGWVHLVGVYVPSTSLKLYVNGSLDSTNTTDIPAALEVDSANATDFVVGSITGSSANFVGGIDDVQVYNVALNASQISTLYNNPGVAVPEPSSLILIGLGLLTMTFFGFKSASFEHA